MGSDDLRARIAEALMAWGERNNDPYNARFRRSETVRQNAAGRADAVMAVVQPEIDELRAENTALLDILADLVDSSACRLDDQGWCEAHSWFWKMPCPHGRARALLKVEEADRG